MRDKNIIVKSILRSYAKATYLTWVYDWPVNEFKEDWTKMAISWSWWKDSCYCLHDALKRNIDVKMLFVVVDSKTKMSLTWPYNVDLLKKQSDSIWIPLYKVNISKDPISSLENFFYLLNKNWIDSLGFWYFIPEWQRELIQELAYKHWLSIFEPNLWVNQEKRLLDLFEIWIESIVVWINQRNMDIKYLWKKLNNIFYDYLKSKKQYTQFCWENWDFQTFVLDAPFFKNSIKLDDYYRFQIGNYIINYYF